MQVILQMAISVNGMIATLDGKEDFLSDKNWQAFVKNATKIGAIIWGHNTYKQVITWSKSYLDSLENVTKVVISKDPNLKLDPRFLLANSPENALDILGENGFNEVIVTGGATINSQFAKKGLIKKVVVSVDSVMLGKGIPLFQPEDFLLKMELTQVDRDFENLLVLHYNVVN